jgi:hypothetical protein
MQAAGSIADGPNMVETSTGWLIDMTEAEFDASVVELADNGNVVDESAVENQLFIPYVEN